MPDKIDYLFCPNKQTPSLYESDTLKNTNMDPYFDVETISRLALEIKEVKKDKFCQLPFCHTLEAESFGARIESDSYGIRINSPVLSKVEDLIDNISSPMESPRITRVKDSISVLKNDDLQVIYELSGPFTILNGLLDSTTVYKGLVKKKQVMAIVLDLLKDHLINFSRDLIDLGVDIISISDSPVDISIVGPEKVKYIYDNFTREFFMELLKIADGKCLIYMCPKMARSLEEVGLIDLKRVNSLMNDYLSLKPAPRHIVTGACISRRNTDIGTRNMMQVESLK